MMKKLIKYDLKNMTRILVYMYAISIALAIITRLILLGKEAQIVYIIGQVFLGCTISAVVNILVNTFVHILRTFLNDFYKDRSYLIHTLPVSKDKLLASKYISSLIVILLSVTVSLLSLFILFYTKELGEGLSIMLSSQMTGFNMSAWVFLALIAGLLLMQICMYMSFGFAAIVKANTYNYKRVIKGIGWFALYYGIANTAVLVTAIVGCLIFSDVSELFLNVVTQNTFLTILVCAFITYLTCAIVFYLICKKTFNKGVNVD